MGLFFNNIHIKKNEEFDMQKLQEHFLKAMTDKGYILIGENDEADISLVIYAPDNSSWISVASDDFEFNTEEKIKSVINPLSDMFHTDLIAAACDDSDYLFLNILNTSDGTDGWINIGEHYGIKNIRRNSLAQWNNKVKDALQLKSIVKEKYIFAEEAFEKVAELIDMSVCQIGLDVSMTSNLAEESLYKLNFKAPGIEKELPKLEISLYSLMPCKIDKSSCVFVKNKGGRSKGIGILLYGDYVENDEITFENVTFESDYGSEKRKIVEINLKKCNLTNGQKGYYWEDPEFIILPAVSKNIPMQKLQDLEFMKEFGVRFTPKGNSRKVLDIKVGIIPLANPIKGQAVWYVYRYAGSKSKFIEEHNETWGDANPDDYDL